MSNIYRPHKHYERGIYEVHFPRDFIIGYLLRSENLTLKDISNFSRTCKGIYLLIKDHIDIICQNIRRKVSCLYDYGLYYEYCWKKMIDTKSNFVVRYTVLEFDNIKQLRLSILSKSCFLDPSLVDILESDSEQLSCKYDAFTDLCLDKIGNFEPEFLSKAKNLLKYDESKCISRMCNQNTNQWDKIKDLFEDNSYMYHPFYKIKYSNIGTNHKEWMELTAMQKKRVISMC